MKSWIVFKQDTLKKPHQMVGSVYAVDAETALLEARTVFARRPKAVSMWVAPTDMVNTWTLEELNAETQRNAEEDAERDGERWEVFWKAGQRRGMTFVDYVGDVVAGSAENALQSAINQFSSSKTIWVWMVVPESAIAKTDDEDIESWFAPAMTKTYKQQSAYGFVGVHKGKKK